jgi:hypothetical protein
MSLQSAGLRRQDDMTDEQLEKFVKERYEERTAYEVRPVTFATAALSSTPNGP